MKNVRLIFIIFLLTIATGCNREHINIPSLDSNTSLLVTNLKEPSISILNLKNEEGSNIGIPFIISAITAKDESYVFAAGKNEKNLFALDFGNNEMRPLFEVGEGIIDMEYNKDNSLLYTANVQKNSIQIIDMEKELVINEIKVGDYPVQMEQHGVFLYVLAGGSGEIYVLDLDKEEVIKTFEVNHRPAGLLFDGELLWVGGHGASGELNDRVYAYDPESGNEITSVKIGLMPIFFHQDEEDSPIYVLSHGDHRLSRLNSTTFQLEDQLELCDNPNFMSGDSDYLYVSCIDGDEVMIIDKKDWKIINSFSFEGGPFLLYKGGTHLE
ncbi:YncE family protein [Sutcliffiella halmapala]|uniref:YncE family protein n=1 Tax=Sutcliffiella halmapala TaxID=79882 RepID=UPI0009957692|nr:YncE family protein [Sutcliffiella halmapala]